MTYSVKEIFYTLQGEGARAGRAAVFLRFAGCNLWSGLEKDRADATCRFCDTDFVGTDGAGGASSAMPRRWPAPSSRIGRRILLASPMWFAPAANRCCSSTGF